MAEIHHQTGKKSEKKAPKSKRKRTHLDMTAMVDVAFLLLTFFVLSATLADFKQIKMTVPPPNPDGGMEVNEEKMLTIILDQDAKVYQFKGVAESGIFETNFSQKGIRSLLLEHKKKEDPIVVIKPKKISKYRSLINVLDELMITGHKKYVLAPYTEQDSLAMASYLTTEHL
ncbi:MAG: biopolymer transporter ExbD [Bacteroidota bacterium]